MDVVGHDDEGVELEAAFGAVLLEDFEEEFGVAFDLEETSSVGGGGGDEERSDFLGCERHEVESDVSGRKARG